MVIELYLENTMNKKSFFLGVITGIVITFVGLLVIGIVNQSSNNNDPIEYLEQPMSYENKTETSFKVIQVLGDAALAKEISDKEFDLYYGNTVLILGSDLYNSQIVTIINPQRIGTYSYTSNSDRPMTVPVIDGEIK